MEEVSELYGNREMLCVADNDFNQHKLPGILQVGWGYIRGEAVTLLSFKKTNDDKEDEKNIETQRLSAI